MHICSPVLFGGHHKLKSTDDLGKAFEFYAFFLLTPLYFSDIPSMMNRHDCISECISGWYFSFEYQAHLDSAVNLISWMTSQ